MFTDRRTLIVVFFTVASIIGFMIKLPRVFHHYDKELHASFYFAGFLFLSYLYPKRWLLIAIVLGLGGVFIEYAQELSNKVTLRLIGKRIHGRFDIEDIEYNLMGLFLGVTAFIITKQFFKPGKTQ